DYFFGVRFAAAFFFGACAFARGFAAVLGGGLAGAFCRAPGLCAPSPRRCLRSLGGPAGWLLRFGCVCSRGSGFRCRRCGLLGESAEAALAALRRGGEQLLALLQRQRLRIAILGDLRVLGAI